MKTIVISKQQAHKVIPQGFSWTTFIFGALPSYLRGDWSLGYRIGRWTGASFCLSFLLCYALKDIDPRLMVVAILPPVVFRFLVASWRNEELRRGFENDGWIDTSTVANDE